MRSVCPSRVAFSWQLCRCGQYIKPFFTVGHVQFLRFASQLTKQKVQEKGNTLAVFHSRNIIGYKWILYSDTLILKSSERGSGDGDVHAFKLWATAPGPPSSSSQWKAAHAPSCRLPGSRRHSTWSNTQATWGHHGVCVTSLKNPSVICCRLIMWLVFSSCFQGFKIFLESFFFLKPVLPTFPHPKTWIENADLILPCRIQTLPTFWIALKLCLKADYRSAQFLY